MAVPNLQATIFNLIFNNLASTTKCLAHTLLPKMVELSANIVMSRKLALISFFIPTFLLGIGLTLSAQRPTLSTGCLCLFLVVFHLLKFICATSIADIGLSNFFEPCALEPSPSPSSPTTTRVSPSPPCHFCADEFAVEPLQVSSSATESTSSLVAVLPVPASATTLVPFAAPMDPIHTTTSAAPASHPMITRAKSRIFKPRHPRSSQLCAVFSIDPCPTCHF
ncbi:hypothetical protein CK203_034873 [Vitis vinifera]|uniref:Uncharacterized protein n=1 Tax=Vitis vinifera TaxID=29760 RepID=A0A438FYU8_VITVI|nr:hypothetical protein CK203_034873 [Vitis vinifera]